MDAASTQYRVRVCSMCPGDAEYFCASCLCNLFLHCRENHVNNLKTIDHNVVIRKKYHYMPIQELCMTHPGNAYKNTVNVVNCPYVIVAENIEITDRLF